MAYRADFLLGPPPPPQPSPFGCPDDAEPGQRWVYLHISAESECLYIGLTRRPEGRTAQHADARAKAARAS